VFPLLRNQAISESLRGSFPTQILTCGARCKAGLHPQSPRHFTRQPKVPVSQTLCSSYLSHVTAASRQQTADHYPQLHLSYCRNTPTYAHIPGCRTLRIESCYKAAKLVVRLGSVFNWTPCTGGSLRISNQWHYVS